MAEAKPDEKIRKNIAVNGDQSFIAQRLAFSLEEATLKTTGGKPSVLEDNIVAFSLLTKIPCKDDQFMRFHRSLEAANLDNAAYAPIVVEVEKGLSIFYPPTLVNLKTNDDHRALMPYLMPLIQKATYFGMMKGYASQSTKDPAANVATFVEHAFIFDLSLEIPLLRKLELEAMNAESKQNQLLKEKVEKRAGVLSHWGLLQARDLIENYYEEDALLSNKRAGIAKRNSPDKDKKLKEIDDKRQALAAKIERAEAKIEGYLRPRNQDATTDTIINFYAEQARSLRGEKQTALTEIINTLKACNELPAIIAAKKASLAPGEEIKLSPDEKRIKVIRLKLLREISQIVAKSLSHTLTLTMTLEEYMRQFKNNIEATSGVSGT